MNHKGLKIEGDLYCSCGCRGNLEKHDGYKEYQNDELFEPFIKHLDKEYIKKTWQALRFYDIKVRIRKPYKKGLINIYFLIEGRKNKRYVNSIVDSLKRRIMTHEMGLYITTGHYDYEGKMKTFRVIELSNVPIQIIAPYLPEERGNYIATFSLNSESSEKEDFYMEEFEQHYEDFLKKGKNTLRNRLSIYPHQKWVTTKKDLAKAVAISKLTENDLVSDETIIELYVNNFTKRQLFILNDLHYSLYSKKTKVGLAQQLIDKIRKPAWNYNDWKRSYGSESSEKDEASILVKALTDAGYETLFVGGVVRDMLMGLEPKDYDLGTSATPEEVANVVNGLEGYKYIFGPEGERAKRALTSLVKPPVGEVIEVTTFRKEMYGKDRSDIDAIPAKTFKEDAARRDLTINSMGMDLDGNIIDYFGGEKDITHRLVKTVGNPDERFREDPLRMIRAIRFAVKYKFALDDATWESIKRNHELVNDLSSKRRRDEIGKVLYYPNGFTLLMESGILPTLMPEFRNMKDYHHKLDYHPEGTLYNHYIEAFKKFTTIPNRTELGGWALLFHDIAKPQTAVWNEEGKYHTFYGHDKQGGQIVLENYNNTNGPFEFSKKELQKIAWTTDNHLGKFWEMKKPMKVAAMRNNENFPLLVQVVTGDTMGIRRGGDEELQARLEEIDKITAEINEKKEKAGNRPSGFAPKVIKELGLRGKEISETLSKIEEMVSTGVVNSYDEALGVLKSKNAEGVSNSLLKYGLLLGIGAILYKNL